MLSVNLNSVQDFSQIPAQKTEQSFAAEGNSSKDFFSMLSENLSKLGEKKSPEIETQNSAQVQREKFREEKSIDSSNSSPKEISEKSVSPEKKSSEADEKKLAHDEKKSEKKLASKNEDEGEKVSSEKNLKTDEILQGAVFANARDAKKASAKKSENIEGKKVARAENEKKSQKNYGIDSEKDLRASAENFSDLENLRVELAKKNFLSEAASSARENDSPNENVDAEIISELPISATFVQNADAKSFEPALKSAGDFSSENAISAKSKREAKIGVIEVKDLRTNAEAAQTEAKDLKKVFVRAPQNDSQGGGIELTMDLAANGEKNILSLDSQSAAADGSNFQAMLKNQITQNAGEFVRAGNIVLRDNDSGTINLVLHPESLGNVKIGLELSGKTVMGHIVVASREAFNAFGDGADVLRNAFIQSGFEDAKFDVSFAGSEMQFAQQNRGGQDDDSSMRQGKKIYGEFVEENISVGFENADKNIGNVLSSSNSIDVVA